MSGGEHFSFPGVFGPGIVGTKQYSINVGEIGQSDVANTDIADTELSESIPANSDQSDCGNFGIPRQLLAAQGYLELATGPAGRFGLAPALRRRTLRKACHLAISCRVEKRHQPARHLLIGQSLRLLGKHRSAIAALRKASLDRWLRRDALLGLAWCQKRLGLIDEAITTITRALAAKPDDADLHYNLACYLALAMQPRAAIYELAWALELKPRLRRRASAEADFDSLRCYEAFAALTDTTRCNWPTWPASF
jgi:tetratricopeptide (TPR) repeat protein